MSHIRCTVFDAVFALTVRYSGIVVFSGTSAAAPGVTSGQDGGCHKPFG